MMIVPLLWKWDGTAMTPLPYFKKQAEKQLEFGRIYRLEAVEFRSTRATSITSLVCKQLWTICQKLTPIAGEHRTAP